MTRVRLVLFSLRQLSLLGHYQAGAEMFGGETRRARADAYRALQIEASEALRAAFGRGRLAWA